jgi:hypothetical protein
MRKNLTLLRPPLPEGIGLPAPSPIPCMALHHQIAQELHGSSEDDSARAHDLIDLQLIVENESIDYEVTRLYAGVEQNNLSFCRALPATGYIYCSIGLPGKLSKGKERFFLRKISQKTSQKRNVRLGESLCCAGVFFEFG